MRLSMGAKVGATYALMGAMIVGVHVAAWQLEAAKPVQVREVRIADVPCKSDDGPGPCYWDAGVRGNGHGRSFWLDAWERPTYLDDRPAKRDREPYGGCDEQWQPGNKIVPECVGH